jgi:hypothetical protein
MVARDRVDRSVESLERQPEVRLVVLHRSGRIDDVRRDDHEAHVGWSAGPDDLVAQDVLRGVALARIADTRNAKSPPVPGGSIASVPAERAPGAAEAMTARVIATRQVSVRCSAQAL